MSLCTVSKSIGGGRGIVYRCDGRRKRRREGERERERERERD